VITVPDFLFSAADFAPGPAVGPAFFPVEFQRNINFDQSATPAGQAGPGNINSPTTIILNKVGPLFENIGTAFLSGHNIQGQSFVWGSFDETTNDPVIYPNGLSIEGLENEILIQISPTPPTLTNGTNGVAYMTTFTTTGGAFTVPYIWSLASGSAQLPTGLTLSSSGTISGTPTQSGTFDFVIQMTDSLGRHIQWSYSITIN
jgi:hypothetical protein